ncbi:MAG TPA: hypothetical protein VMH00_12370 [Candidatus Limnocylindrales bacterium]|nr:hypothetical protein [Candidatus Limnocylindrales bacterium]
MLSFPTVNSRRHTSFSAVVLALLAGFACPASSFAQAPVTIRVDASASLGPLRPVWSYFGYDEPNYTYTPHGRELISELASSSTVPIYIRTHNLLTTGDGTPALKWGSTNAYTEDVSGKPVYDWTIVDRIFDTYLHARAKPFVELGFMPEALSTHPQPYQHHWPKGPLDTGWSYPPRDYSKWEELVYQFVRHCEQRYGDREVASWYFEVWNEPDIFYWHGTREEYEKLYDFSAEAVKRAMPAARVGGPATTGPGNPKAAEYLRAFLEHCARGTNFVTGKPGAPLDFISFHAKGSPKAVDGHVEMGLAANLKSADRGFEIVASFPQFAKLPVVLSESDPDGCAACASRLHPDLAYRNGTLYPAYTAAAFDGILKLARSRDINLAGIVTWAFEFENQPYFEGFRTLATNGIDKPELNFFRMARHVAGEQLKSESSGAESPGDIIESGVRANPDVDALAARGKRSITVMIWNYHDDDVPGPNSQIALSLVKLPPEARRLRLRHYRIDRDHSNAYTVWLALGSPQNPTPGQVARLKAAAQLQSLEPPRSIAVQNGEVSVNFSLPRESISLLEFSW